MTEAKKPAKPRKSRAKKPAVPKKVELTIEQEIDAAIAEEPIISEPVVEIPKEPSKSEAELESVLPTPEKSSGPFDSKPKKNRRNEQNDETMAQHVGPNNVVIVRGKPIQQGSAWTS